MNKQIKEEMATREDNIGVDEEDEQEHHHDFEDDESNQSVYSHGIDDVHNNQSVDSDKVGGIKGGPRSHRQSNLSDQHQNNLVVMNPGQGNTAERNVESDMESEKSGVGAAQQYHTMYQSYNA